MSRETFGESTRRPTIGTLTLRSRGELNFKTSKDLLLSSPCDESFAKFREVKYGVYGLELWPAQSTHYPVPKLEYREDAGPRIGILSESSMCLPPASISSQKSMP